MTSAECFALVEGHFERVVRSLDLALLLEHVRKLDQRTYARYFRGFRPQTLGRKRVAEALHSEVFDHGNSTVGDILTLLWNQEHRGVYHAMLELVRTISEDVESIKSIDDAKANEFIDTLSATFDGADILVCVRLNEVKFSEAVISARLGGAGAAAPAPLPPGGLPDAPVGEPSPAHSGEVSQNNT